MIIAIDGPAGAGKSTLAKRIAQELNLQLIETGALYRAVALLAQENDIALDDYARLEEVARTLTLRFESTNGGNLVWLDDRDITSNLRAQPVEKHASVISSYPGVRSALLEQQRTLANARDSVLEGRDIGTVVCPHADVKFFVSASAKVRAERRTEELKRRGISADYESVLQAIVERDERDSTREVAPLEPAADAIPIETSDRSIDEVLAQMIQIIGQNTGT